MKFYGELGCGLETNCLHFGDKPQSRFRITIQIREELPQFYYAGVRWRSLKHAGHGDMMCHDNLLQLAKIYNICGTF